MISEPALGTLSRTDYKAWAQMALFIIYPYLSDGHKEVWLALSKVSLYFNIFVANCGIL